LTANQREPADSIRIHVHLRGADVALMDSMGSAEIWYFLPHADLPPADELPTWCKRVTPLSAVLRIFRTRARTIEIPEPLWARFLPVGMTLMVATRIARRLTGRPARTVFYALENNAPERALFGDGRTPSLLRQTFVKVLGSLISLLVDRVAFGSPSARRAYDQITTLRLKDVLELTELPARAEAGLSPEASHTRSHALFVGGMERRKGIRELLPAWDLVERSLPSATITIIGSGPLEPEVSRWVSMAPERREFLGQVSHSELSSYYRSADVLVAPSVRDGRWREQIGLQIRESLSEGLTVVASDESGLADWLSEHGHRVVPANVLAESLGPAIIDALAHPLPRSTVIQSLPDEDGRVMADKWLHRP
jgi:glycosyltransferase involved in cell wall biosynthesis